MLINNKWLIFTSAFSIFSLFSMEDNSKVSQLLIEEAKNGIHSFDAKYAEDITKIARKNIKQLVSLDTNTQEERDYRLESNIVANFDNKALIKKVYLLDGKPVGFINYKLYIPWHRSLFFGEPNAKILHLAVDENNRNLGIGSKLLKYALKDCKDKSVKCVSLFTTTTSSEKLYEFYSGKHGFTNIGKTRNIEHYTKRLKPHPLLTIAKSCLRFFKK